MLTKEEFIEYINFIQQQRDKQSNFLDALEELADNKEYCNCFLYASYEDKLVKLLKTVMNDKDDDIGFFLYDMDDVGPAEDQDGNILYKTVSELYDYLIKKG